MMKDYDRIAKKITIVLFLSQSLSSAGFIAAFTVNALVGVDLTGQRAMAGVPGGLYVVGQACGAMVWGFSMERIGRRRSIALGQLIGAIGSAIAVTAVVARSFSFFLFGLVLVGMARQQWTWVVLSRPKSTCRRSGGEPFPMLSWAVRWARSSGRFWSALWGRWRPGPATLSCRELILPGLQSW